MIHVCFVIHDKTGRYSKFAGTTMLSIFENSPPPRSTCVHILHDDTLTQDNRNKFSHLAKQYNQLVKFYNVEKLCADKINKYVALVPSVKDSRVTRGAFYKFLIPDILDASIKKVIYLDADIIVNLDINELWQIEMANKPLAVVLEIDNGALPSIFSRLCREGFVKEENYFNSGMIVMNLAILRREEDNISAGIKFRGEHPKFFFFDQEIFNYCFETRTLKLPAKFNRLLKESRKREEFFVGKEIYHYAGDKMGLGLDINDPYNRLWWSYFIRTPWFDVDTMDKIIKGATDSMLKPFAVPPDKARVFIVDEAHAYQIERNFSVRDEEEVIVIDTESEDILQQLTDLLGSSEGKKFFFIGIPNITPKLKELRFVEGKDFFNVSAFYSPAWADLTKNYSLILEM